MDTDTSLPEPAIESSGLNSQEEVHRNVNPVLRIAHHGFGDLVLDDIASEGLRYDAADKLPTTEIVGQEMVLRPLERAPPEGITAATKGTLRWFTEKRGATNQVKPPSVTSNGKAAISTNIQNPTMEGKEEESTSRGLISGPGTDDVTVQDLEESRGTVERVRVPIDRLGPVEEYLETVLRFGTAFSEVCALWLSVAPVFFSYTLSDQPDCEGYHGIY